MSAASRTPPESEALMDSTHSSRRTFLSTGIAAAAVAAAPAPLLGDTQRSARQGATA